MKTTKRVLVVLLVLAMGLALFAPAAQGLFIRSTRIINPGFPGLISPSINWFALLNRIFMPLFNATLSFFSSLFWGLIF